MESLDNSQENDATKLRGRSNGDHPQEERDYQKLNKSRERSTHSISVVINERSVTKVGTLKRNTKDFGSS